MDDQARQAALQRRGVVLTGELGGHPGRQAERDGLVPMLPGAYLASTQPWDIDVVFTALRKVAGERDWVVMGAGALWIYGVRPQPEEIDLGLPLTHKLKVPPPLRTHRLSPSVLRSQRSLDEGPVVALEVAVIQTAATESMLEIRELVESLLRDRRTTLTRLRARCRRGVKGSALVRRVCDDLAGGSIDNDVRRLKKALEDRGVTGLEVEVRFENAEGASAYADLLHRPTMTLFEVDGYVTHTQRDRFRSDRRRDRWMLRQKKALTIRIAVMEVRENLDELADELVWFTKRPEMDSQTG